VILLTAPSTLCTAPLTALPIEWKTLPKPHNSYSYMMAFPALKYIISY
jgi:hypothetical protein